MKLNNKVGLITYPDSLGSNLKDLNFVLDNYIKDAIGGIHILPFYPSSADRGFCPLTHLEVDSKFGDWKDIKKISSKYDLMVDLMANHLSSESKYFKDYLKKCDKSKYKDLFLSANDVFKKFDTNSRLTKKIYLRRLSAPFSEYRFNDGSVKKLWTTFSSRQIDVNWNSDITKKIMYQSSEKLARYGAKVIRLDAVGYIAKKEGTSCFLLPKSYDIIEDIRDSLKKYDVKMLPEVHSHYNFQKKIAKREDYTYDFALPLMVLYTLFGSSSRRLKKWIKIRPNNCFTTLDTHDGLGVVDVEGLLTKRELNMTLSMIYKHGGNSTAKASGKNSENVDIYQVNTTYYSALGKNDKAYLCARVIQFFLPGIPQVYYVGLFVGKNDVKLLNETRNGRDVNRHYYNIKEIEKNMQRPVVKRLFELMKFRNAHPAFNGKFRLHMSRDSVLKLSWRKGDAFCKLRVNLKDYSFDIEDSLKQNKI